MTYEQNIVDLQRAKEAAEVVVTTEEAGVVIVHMAACENILVFYNHYTEEVAVLEYEPGTLKELARHVTNEPITLAKMLCGKYQIE